MNAMKERCLAIFVLAIFATLCNRIGAYEVKSVPTCNLPVEAQVTISVPEHYGDDTSARYPTVYLLNGHGGDHLSWSKIVDIDSLATAHNVIIVCPAGLNSWYFDAPANKAMKMESYIIDDLVKWVDVNYRTKAIADKRAITGLSMGGHGALWLAIRNPDVFGNVGSTSGGVDFRPWPRSWNLPDALGVYDKNKAVWNQHTVISLIDSLSLKNLNIIIDCGEQDFFFRVNNTLHLQMQKRGIKHKYLTSPGVHNGEYWAKSILPQMQFFSDCFAQ